MSTKENSFKLKTSGTMIEWHHYELALYHSLFNCILWVPRTCHRTFELLGVKEGICLLKWKHKWTLRISFSSNGWTQAQLNTCRSSISIWSMNLSSITLYMYNHSSLLSLPSLERNRLDASNWPSEGKIQGKFGRITTFRILKGIIPTCINVAYVTKQWVYGCIFMMK